MERLLDPFLIGLANKNPNNIITKLRTGKETWKYDVEFSKKDVIRIDNRVTGQKYGINLDAYVPVEYFSNSQLFYNCYNSLQK